MRYVRLLLRTKRFPERQALGAMLSPAGLQVVTERTVRGLHRQLSVLAIGVGD